MLTPMPATWTVRGATFALWALAAASAAFWGLKLGGAGSGVQAPLPPARAVVSVDPAAIGRLLGGVPTAAAAPAQPTLASRFQLVGVAAGERSGAGAAVIAVDGKPARPYRVGTSLDQGIVLQSVHGRSATIAANMSSPPLLTLELPSPRTDVPAFPAPVSPPRIPLPSAATPPPVTAPTPATTPTPAPDGAQPAPGAAPRFPPPPGTNVPARRQPQPPAITAPR